MSRKSRLLFPFLTIGLLAAGPGRGRTTAEVKAPALEVFAGPSASAFVTGRLRRGDPVVVVGEAADGWLPIAPPDGSFSWIDAEALSGRGRVGAAGATVRPGAEGARMPGPPTLRVKPGEVVRPVARPDLVLQQRGSPKTFRAIEPPAREVRYVRSEGVRLRATTTEPSKEKRVPPTDHPDPIDPRLARAGPVVDESRLPPGLADELARLDAEHRAALREPLDRWDLGPIRSRCEGLLKAHDDPASRAALRARLDRIGRQEALARRASAFESALGRSRARDRALDGLQARVDRSEESARRPFDARGLLQASSRRVGGEEVFALIGEDGRTSAYLKIPPGVPTDRLLTRTVGVRGPARFDEGLRNRLIRVREIEPITPGAGP